MSFANVRKILFQFHMWIGLVLGILFAALGLSGSAIVYDQEIANFLNPPPQATASGQLLSLDRIADAARAVAGHGQIQIMLPETVGQAVIVRVGQISPMGPMPQAAGRNRGSRGGRGARRGAERQGLAGNNGPGRGVQLYIDPVSGAVLGKRTAALPPFLTFAHQLHGNFLMGRDGRSYVVGWLGVGMCILGLTGLALWWPRRGQWKYAFGVRRTAKGLRFHRELHAAVGIWVFVVFIAVSFSGVALAWPQIFGMPQGPGALAMSRVEPAGTQVGLDAALKLALQSLPNATPRAITLPARDDQPISVALLSHSAVAATVLVDPYKAQVVAVRDPSGSFGAWQRPVHQGLLGPVWRFLVFLVGFVPTLFVTTGTIMWWKKYRRRLPMNAPLAEETAG